MDTSSIIFICVVVVFFIRFFFLRRAIKRRLEAKLGKNYKDKSYRFIRRLLDSEDIPTGQPFSTKKETQVDTSRPNGRFFNGTVDDDD